MTKYKVGDKVLVVPAPNRDSYVGWAEKGSEVEKFCGCSMDNFLDKFVTIKRAIASNETLIEENVYKIEEDDGLFYWGDDCFVGKLVGNKFCK